MKISKSKRFFTLLIATTFTLFGLLVLCPVSVFAATDIYLYFNNNLRFSFSIYLNGVLDSSIGGASDRHRVYTSSDSLDSFYCYSAGRGYGRIYYYYGGDQELSTDPDNPTVIYIDQDINLYINDLSVSGVTYYVRYLSGSPSPSTPTPSPTPTPTPVPTPTPDPAEWLNNYIFNQTSEDMWVGVEDINADDVTYDVIPSWSYKNFYFRRNTTYRIIARTVDDNVYYSLQYYTDLYNYVPLEYSLSSEGWYTYTEFPYTRINISTGSDTNTSGIYTFVRFRHDLPTLPPVTPVPGSSFTPGPSSTPTEAPYVTPIPSNPTLIPDNSTPTPIPDISGEAVAGFNKLTNIFNGIFDAAYQSVNAANGNFWTSFFFIGLPIFLVILGLIAWIIFGLSDDDQ